MNRIGCTPGLSIQLLEVDRERKTAWLNACRWDGLDPSESFVRFSCDNPHAHSLDLLEHDLCSLQRRTRLHRSPMR